VRDNEFTTPRLPFKNSRPKPLVKLQIMFTRFVKFLFPPPVAGEEPGISPTLSVEGEFSGLVAKLIPAIKTINLTGMRRVEDNRGCSVRGDLSLGGKRCRFTLLISLPFSHKRSPAPWVSFPVGFLFPPAHPAKTFFTAASRNLTE